MSTEPTLFQKIYNGEIPGEILYKDDLVFVIKNIYPEAKVHLLIIPIKPIPTAADVEFEDEEMLGRLFIAGRKVAEQLQIDKMGYRLIVNCRQHGGQEIYHLHMHLLGGEQLGAMNVR